DPADRPETAAVLSSLRRPTRGSRPSGEDLTMPFVLAPGGPDVEDPTDVLGPRTAVAPVTGPATAATGPITTPFATPVTAEPAHGRLLPPVPQAWRPPPAGLPRLQRGALLLGML